MSDVDDLMKAIKTLVECTAQRSALYTMFAVFTGMILAHWLAYYLGWNPQ